MQTKYPNIFATGDCVENNIPRGFLSGCSQNNVVRHNVLQMLNGGELNASYEGFSEVFVPEGFKSSLRWKKLDWDTEP